VCVVYTFALPLMLELLLSVGMVMRVIESATGDRVVGGDIQSIQFVSRHRGRRLHMLGYQFQAALAI